MNCSQQKSKIHAPAESSGEKGWLVLHHPESLDVALMTAMGYFHVPKTAPSDFTLAVGSISGCPKRETEKPVEILPYIKLRCKNNYSGYFKLFSLCLWFKVLDKIQASLLGLFLTQDFLSLPLLPGVGLPVFLSQCSLWKAKFCSKKCPGSLGERGRLYFGKVNVQSCCFVWGDSVVWLGFAIKKAAKLSVSMNPVNSQTVSLVHTCEISHQLQWTLC